MSNLLATSSIEAMMLAGVRDTQMGRPFRPAGDFVELRLLYDPFEPEAVEVHELEYRADRSLAEYLGTLPEETEWMVFHNGIEVEDIGAADQITVQNGDRIGVLVLPLGNGGFKSILRIVLQAAAIATMFVFPQLSFLAVMAINIGVGLVNAFLLVPKAPKMADNGNEGNSYGIDGAKNSATEGIPYPVVYGEFRVAGNFSDCFTENVGDDQYLYLRTVLNDGEVDWIGDIELNEQPIANFKDVEIRTELGTLTQTANSWFGRSIQQRNKGIKLDTSWTYHTTTTAVDKVRFDIVFPQGLVDIDEKKGKHRARSVQMEVQYRQVSAVGAPLTPFVPLPNEAPSTYDSDVPGGSPGVFGETANDISRAVITAQAPVQSVVSPATNPRVQYRPTGGAWTDLEAIPLPEDNGSNYVYEATDGSVVGNGFTPYAGYTYDVDGLNGDYQFQALDGAVIQKVVTYPTTGSTSVRISDSRTRQIRKSIETEQLDRGYYEVAIRRSTAQSTTQYIIDEVYLTDVGEITCEPTNLRGTANLSLRVRLNEQLNNIPQVSCKVRCKVRQYDAEGNQTAYSHTKNLAWHALDVLVGPERGAGINASRIDWPAWVDFAAHCTANNLEFNGVFDTGSNIGDVLMEVCRAGHAMPVPFGTKMSVAIDRPRDPVMMFNSANIIEDSFEMGYMSLNERANEYEVSYFDKTDRNKQKTIRYVDPKAVTFNEMPRKASVTFRGIDNVAQAKGELWRMIYANRLLVRTINFDAWLDAIALNLGDVALIQHSMMEWAQDGKLGTGSTASSIVLDKTVTVGTGTHAMLVHFDALALGTLTINSVVGSKIMVPTSSLSDAATIKTLKRARNVAGTVEHEIVEVTKGSTYDTIQLAGPATGFSAGTDVVLWNTDVVVERDVQSVATADGISTVTLVSALPQAPTALANFIFGKKVEVKKPYVLTAIAGRGVEKRTLSFVEYHAGVYAAPEIEIPIPVTRVTDRQVAHVQTLLVDHESQIESGRKLLNARVHWSAGHILSYGGADIYMSLNGNAMRPLPSAVDVTEYHVQLAPDDEVTFKVVAFNKRGDRAPEFSAPLVSGVLNVTYADLDAPTAFVAAQTAFQVEGTVKFTFTKPVDQTGIEEYEIQYKRTVDSLWTAAGIYPAGPVAISGVPTGSYNARIRAVSSTSTSVWVTANFTVAVTAGSVMANFLTSNDNNSAAIAAPTLPAANPVQHTLNTDSSADVSFEWIWSGSEASIDGFEIKVISV